MKTEPTNPPVTLRPVDPADEPFLFTLYASSRADELAPLGWGETQRTVFLRMQYAAQQRDYGARFDVAGHQIIIVAGRDAGHIWVERNAEEIRVVDLALLPSARGSGVGTYLFNNLIAEAGQAGLPLRLSVPKHNTGGRRLYERLGFKIIGEISTHFRMEYSKQ